MTREHVRQDAKTEQQSAQRTKLVDKYREVGPAAIKSALICQKANKAQKNEPRRPHDTREDDD